LKDVARNKFKTADLLQHRGHTEWVRQGNISTTYYYYYYHHHYNYYHYHYHYNYHYHYYYYTTTTVTFDLCLTGQFFLSYFRLVWVPKVNFCRLLEQAQYCFSH